MRLCGVWHTTSFASATEGAAGCVVSSFGEPTTIAATGTCDTWYDAEGCRAEFVAKKRAEEEARKEKRAGAEAQGRACPPQAQGSRRHWHEECARHVQINGHTKTTFAPR